MQKNLSVCATVFLGMFLAVSTACFAREVKGITFPETETIGDAAVKLVGIGLRKKLIINVYLGALYMEKPENAPQVISSDQPKRVVLHFLYRSVGADDLIKAWNEGFRNNVPDRVPVLKGSIATFIGFFTEPVKNGEKIIITYIPGTGTEVSVKGKVKGVIPGKDFMEALFSIWFGEAPPSGDLKKGMLGEK